MPRLVEATHASLRYPMGGCGVLACAFQGGSASLLPPSAIVEPSPAFSRRSPPPPPPPPFSSAARMAPASFLDRTSSELPVSESPQRHAERAPHSSPTFLSDLLPSTGGARSPAAAANRHAPHDALATPAILVGRLRNEADAPTTGGGVLVLPSAKALPQASIDARSASPSATASTLVPEPPERARREKSPSVTHSPPFISLSSSPVAAGATPPPSVTPIDSGSGNTPLEMSTLPSIAASVPQPTPTYLELKPAPPVDASPPPPARQMPVTRPPPPSLARPCPDGSSPPSLSSRTDVAASPSLPLPPPRPRADVAHTAATRNPARASPPPAPHGRTAVEAAEGALSPSPPRSVQRSPRAVAATERNPERGGTAALQLPTAEPGATGAWGEPAVGAGLAREPGLQSLQVAGASLTVPLLTSALRAWRFFTLLMSRSGVLGRSYGQPWDPLPSHLRPLLKWLAPIQHARVRHCICTSTGEPAPCRLPQHRHRIALCSPCLAMTRLPSLPRPPRSRASPLPTARASRLVPPPPALLPVPVAASAAPVMMASSCGSAGPVLTSKRSARRLLSLRQMTAAPALRHSRWRSAQAMATKEQR